MVTDRYLSAREAARALGVSVPTLYAYVSRGLVRSEAGRGPGRERRYAREDIERLRERQAQRRDPARAAARALRWGTPVLESGLTLIDQGRLYYRGHDALKLAEECTFEQVAALLWTGTLPAERPALFADTATPGLAPYAPALRLAAAQDPAALFEVVLPLAGQHDAAAHDLRPAAVQQTGARVLRLLAAAAVYPAAPAGGGLAEALQQRWAPRRRSAARLIDAALILCADHELNVSAFTARCVASAAATPYDVVIAGLAALRGSRHGGHTARVEALLDEIGAPARAGHVLRERLRRGETLPGFGHRLYPEGDPRGRALLRLAARYFGRARAVAVGQAAAAEAQGLLGEAPTLDFGLVVLALSLGLPPGGALALFALGRTAGWIGQALEQYQTGEMIRPRARYSGPRPAETE
jgi:citrate synthase